MSEHSYQVVENVSWFKNLINSFLSSIFGIIFLIGSIIAMIWNEGSYYDRLVTLETAQKEVISIDPRSIIPSLEGKLVHFTGMATTNDILKDEQFNISQRAIKLIRKVEMYQWEEKKRTESNAGPNGSTNNTTTYSYSKKWSNDIINSDNFHKKAEYSNPQSFPFENITKYAQNVTVEKYSLSKEFITQINNSQPFQLTEEFYNNLPSLIREKYKIHNNYLYSGSNFNEPNIGDVRIIFNFVGDNTVSLMGMQNKNQISTYYLPNGEISLLQVGHASQYEMIKDAQESNLFWTWAIRLGSIFTLFLGFRMLFSPIHALVYFIPHLREFVDMGIGFVCFILAIFIGPVVMSLAWISNRPAISLAIIAVVFIVARSIVRYAKNKQARKNNLQYQYSQ